MTIRTNLFDGGAGAAPGAQLRMMGGLQGAGLGLPGMSSGQGLTEPVFVISANQSPAELLAALSFVRPSAVSTSLDNDGQVVMKVEVESFKTADQGASPRFEGGNPPSPVEFGVNAKKEYVLQRLGRSVATYRTDLHAAEAGTVSNLQQTKVVTAISQLLYWMNVWLGGPEAGQPGFVSVLGVASGVSRIDPVANISVTAAARRLLTEVWTRGEGAGEGIHCLLGNSRMLRTLMSAAADTSNCGYWLDRRSGMTVYHYQGVPFYRVPFPDTDADTKGWLVGANLGATGLQMVHVTGTSESRGLQLETQPIDASAGTVVQLVQGAMTPVLWDPFGIMAYGGIAYGVA